MIGDYTIVINWGFPNREAHGNFVGPVSKHTACGLSEMSVILYKN